MNLLLLCPKPAERSRRRTSRMEQQLDDITDAIRELVSGLESASGLQELVYDKLNSVQSLGEYHGERMNHQDLVHLLERTDLLIDVSTFSRTRSTQLPYQGSVLQIGPTFPGSFARSDISFRCWNNSSASHCTIATQSLSASLPMPSSATFAQRMSLSIASAVAGVKQVVDSDHSSGIDPTMHYSAYAPLPYRFGDSFYRCQRQHALVFLSYGLNNCDEQQLDTDKAVLADVLQRVHELRSVTLIYEHRKNAPLIQNIADTLANSLGLSPMLWGLQDGDYRDLYAVMAKADLALFGGSSLYADAVESGLPSYVWRASQSGYEPITAAFNDYIDSSNKEQAIDTQRRLLDRQISQLQGSVAIANRQHDFSTVFQQLLSHLHTGANAATDHDATLASTNIKHNVDSRADALRVIDQPALWQKNTLQQQLSRSAWKNKRKLAKFCESPERFMQDSNNRIVRQFLTLLK